MINQIIFTSAGTKKEGKEYSRWFDTAEEAWINYNKLMARYMKNNPLVIKFIDEPRIVVLDVPKFNGGDPIVLKRYNIYSRFKVTL